MRATAAEKMTCVWPQMSAKVLDKVRKLTVKDKQMLAMLESISDKPDDPMTAGLLDITVV